MGSSGLPKGSRRPTALRTLTECLLILKTLPAPMRALRSEKQELTLRQRPAGMYLVNSIVSLVLTAVSTTFLVIAAVD